MSKLHYILILMIVLAVAFFTRWLLTSVEEPTTVDRELQPQNPDYYLTNFSTIVYDKDGKATYHLTAKHLEHFPFDDVMKIEKLELKYLNKKQETWFASADNGKILKDESLVQLSNNVVVKSKTRRPETDVNIRTSSLNFDFEKKRASTGAKVNILGKNSSIKAVGMTVDLETGTLTLESKATGSYVPK